MCYPIVLGMSDTDRIHPKSRDRWSRSDGEQTSNGTTQSFGKC